MGLLESEAAKEYTAPHHGKDQGKNSEIKSKNSSLSEPLSESFSPPNFPSHLNFTPEDLASVPEPDSQLEEIEAENRGFLPVLANRSFLALWSGQVFSQLADKVYLVLMIGLVASLYGTAGQTISGWVSGIMIAFTIPAVLFGSIAGVFVDRWSKKAVLVTTNILRGALVLILPFLLWLTKDWGAIANLPVGFYILLGITFLVSTLTQFFAPAEQATIPLILEKRDLLSANSLYTTTMMASLIIGFAVGEPVLGIAEVLLKHLGWDWGKELVVGGAYIIAGLILLGLRTGEALNPPEVEPPHVWQDIQDGLAYLGQQRHVRSALIQLTILFSIFAALAVLAVRMAQLIPGMKPTQFGFLLAAAGLGLGLGALVLGSVGQKFPPFRLSFWGFIGLGAALGGLSIFREQLVIILGLITIVGFFGAMVGIPMQTTVQGETPEELRGKVFGLQNNVVNIALSLPLLLVGVAETLYGLQVVFSGLAIIAVVGGGLTYSISGNISGNMSSKVDKQS
jgi:MFS family permease